MSAAGSRRFVVLVLALLAAVVFMGVGAALHWLSLEGPPVAFHGVDVRTPTVRAGQDVRLVYTLSRQRACPALIVGFWIGRDGEALERIPPVTGGYGEIGANVRTAVSIRAPYQAGRACYRSDVLSICDQRNYNARTPSACVEVVP